MRSAVEWTLMGLVLLGALPLTAGAYQYLLVGLHRYRNHYDRCAEHLPRTAVLIPAWNEAAVLDKTIDNLMRLDYPRDRLRIYVVDDASTDDTPALLATKSAQYPGSVVHLRREQGGQGKAHTLNHGLGEILADSWMEALLIMDADVVYTAPSLRRMTRHLADPDVGAVTAYIKEGSTTGTLVNRYVGYEYVTAQAAARRTQNVLGALACLAGGAQLHSRANLEAIGGRIDTSTLAEDTITTFRTQLEGRRVVFEPNAIVWAEEPASIDALWKQRLRWARGNLQVTRMFKHLWFRRSPDHGLGGVSFGIFWFSTLLLPGFMILSSFALVALWLLDSGRARDTFAALWIINALSFVFTTVYALLIDPQTARRSWRQSLMFPGLVSLVIMAWACFPAVFHWLTDGVEDASGQTLSEGGRDGVILAVYIWVSVCMLAAYVARRLDRAGASRPARVLLWFVGFGPLLCAVTVAAYVKEWRGAEQVWEKTEKVGNVAERT